MGTLKKKKEYLSQYYLTVFYIWVLPSLPDFSGGGMIYTQELIFASLCDSPKLDN